MDKYKAKLEEEKNRVVSELSGLGKQNPETGLWEAVPEMIDSNEADSNSNADRFENFEESSATLKTLSERLDEIEHALALIETGTYGTCEVCGNEIESERLEANPAAKTCTAHM